MRIISRKSAITLGAALALATLVLAICAHSVRADKPTTIPAYFDDQVVYVIPGVSPNVVGITQGAVASKVANPLYVVAGQDITHVLGVAIPGVSGYNPHWDLVYVTVNSDRDLSTDPFTSEDEILDAALSGEVTLDDSGFVLLCQVVSQK